MAAPPPQPLSFLHGGGESSVGPREKERRRHHHPLLLVPQLLCSDAQDSTFYERLILPGSFGRMELLRPFVSGSCRACSMNGSGGVKKTDWITIVGNSCDNEEGGNNRVKSSSSSPSRRRRIWCESCLSIKSMAKFIPRTNFLNFTFHDDSSTSEGEDVKNLNEARKRKRKESNSNEGVRLTISGLNASRLVRIASTTHSNTRDSLSSSPSSQVVELSDGDVISLLWHRNGQNNNGSVAGRCGNDAMNEYPSSSATLEPLIQYRLVRIEEDATDLETDAHYGGSTSLFGCFAKGDDEAPIRTTKDDGVAISTISHTRHNYARNRVSDQHRERLEGEVNRRQPTDDINDDVGTTSSNNCNDGIENLHEEESEEEDDSAPLSLPSRFLASYSNSFSFDSIEKSSPSQPSNNPAIAIDISKDVRSKETTCGEITLLDHNVGAKETPRKTNVTTLRETISVPITSLSYDQLVQLHEETSHPMESSPSSSSLSIRHTVLSLTLALTSNVSPYQSNLLRRNKANANVGGTGVNTTLQQILPRHWIPRLLLGTRMNIQKNIYDTNADNHDFVIGY